MRKFSLLMVTAAVLPLAACTDDVLTPAATGGLPAARADVVNSCAGPGAAQRVAQATVTNFGAVPNDGQDDTCALQQAVYAAHNVYLPSGTYQLSQPVLLPSRSRVYGVDSTSLVIMSASGVSAFATRGNGTAFVDSVTVEQLGFRAPSDAGYVLAAVSSRHVLVQNVVAERLRLLHVTTHLPINVWDGTADPAATAGLTSEAQLSRDIRVLNSRGVGNYLSGGSGSGAIYIQYAKDVTIEDNRLDNYQHGIQWWGGDANPSRGGAHGIPRWFRNALIRHNTVTNTEAGIWGAMGQDVRVEENYVEFCADVCLDAEGDVRTVFWANQARNAGHAVMDAFHFATDVTFGWNDVRITDDRFGGYLFHTHNGSQDPAQISIRAHNNTFRWQRSTGVGVVSKEAAAYTNFSNNTLEDVVIEMIPNNSGGLYLNGNTLTFTRSTGGRPGILLGNNYGPGGGPITPVNSGWELEVGGNQLSSSVTQSAAGIRVNQNAGGQIDSWIYSSTIRGFYPSIAIQRSGTDKTFTITNNQHSAPIPASETNVVVQNNSWLYPLTQNPNTASCPDPQQVICTP